MKGEFIGIKAVVSKVRAIVVARSAVAVGKASADNRDVDIGAGEVRVDCGYFVNAGCFCGGGVDFVRVGISSG